MGLVDFYRDPPVGSWRELANAIEQFSTTEGTWTAEAEANDVERLREVERARQAQRAAGVAPKPWKPRVAEYGLRERLLAMILAELQAANRPDDRHRVITPATGEDVLDEETVAAEQAAFDAARVDISDEDYAAFASGEWDGVSPRT